MSRDPNSDERFPVTVLPRANWFRCAVIAGLLAPGATAAVAEAAPMELDPPLSERSLGALHKACSASQLERLTHRLVLRGNAGHRASRPAARDASEWRLDPLSVIGISAKQFCHILEDERAA